MADPSFLDQYVINPVQNAFTSLTKGSDLSGLPYGAQEAALAKRQKMAELLMQQGQQQPEVLTYKGIAAQPSVAGGLGKALSQFMGAYMGGKAEEDLATAKKAARDEAITARQNYYKLPDYTGLVMSNEPAGETKVAVTAPEFTIPGSDIKNPAVTGYGMMPNLPRTQVGTVSGAPRSLEDKNRLLDEWEMSDNPYLAKLSSDMRTREKPQFIEGSKYGNYKVNAQGQLEEVIKPTQDADQSGLAKLMGEYNSFPPNDPRRQIWSQMIKKEITTNPGVRVDLGSKAYESTLAGLDKDQLTNLQTKATTARNILSSLNEMQRAADQNIYSGNFADVKAKYAPLFSWLGVDQNKINNSQAYQAQAGNLVLAKIKQLGNNPTDADVEFIKQTIPTLSMQAPARKMLIDYLRRTAKNDISTYSSARTYYEKNKSMSGFGDEGTSGSGNW
jgi:hypothetical protein